MFRVLILTALLAGSAAAQTWMPGPSAPTGGAPREHAALVWWNGTLYALGGTPFVAGDGSSQVLSGGNWVATAETPGSYLYLRAGVDAMNRVVVFSGEDATGNPNETYEWTPLDGDAGGLENPSGQAPTARAAAAVDSLGRLYTIGGGPGATSAPGNLNSGRVERYEAASDNWSVLAPLPTPVADAAACHDGAGHILVFGGFDAAGVRTANVASFDIASGTWSDTAIPDMPTARNGHAAVRGADGRIYVIGGSDGVELATVDVYDLATGFWTTGPAMATARRHFGCALHPATGQIWVLGGITPAGGVATCETLQTPTCPQLTAPAAAVSAYAGGPAGIAFAVDGTAPFTFSWTRDGVPIANGPTAQGSTITGADGPGLGIVAVTLADAGDYVCTAVNACGVTASMPVTLTVLPAPALPASFAVEVRVPAGALASRARDVRDGVVVGGADFPHPQYGSTSHPIRWDANGVAQDLTPANSVGGEIVRLVGDFAAGWWWWPYTAPQGTGYNKHASIWTNAGTTHVNTQSSGWEFGGHSDTDGTRILGTQTFDESSTNSHGFLWNQLGPGAVSLTPSGAWGSSAAAMDGPFQYGSVHLGFGVVHAFRWQGSGATAVDFNPPGSSMSYVSGAGDGLQVGRATFGGVPTPGIWAGSAESFVPLLPAGATSGSLTRTMAGLQIGTYQGPAGSHAALWAGNASSMVDLHDFLPADFTSSAAQGLDVAADGTITVVGYGYNATNARSEALVWTGLAGPTITIDTPQLSVATGGWVHFDLAGGPALANRHFVLGGSVSGTTPGIVLTPTVTVPLNFDFYLEDLLQSPSPWINPVFGLLDATGHATASGYLPAGVLALPFAISLHHAFVVGTADDTSFEAASNAVELVFTP
ncbi:MAG: kelch repeat-containing protein [Planctomycetota bacterium]